MQRNAFANTLTAAFFFLLAGLFSVFFLAELLLGFGVPIEGRVTSIGFAVLFGGLEYRVLWGRDTGTIEGYGLRTRAARHHNERRGGRFKKGPPLFSKGTKGLERDQYPFALPGNSVKLQSFPLMEAAGARCTAYPWVRAA
jgi:hypothetical protein